MYKFIILFFIFIIGINTYAAQVPQNAIADIEKKLPNLESVNCKFIQKRTIGINTIESYGKFSFIKNKGIVFDTIFPVKSTTVYSSQNNPFINDIILAVSNKNLSVIAKQFEISYEQNGQNWNINLKTKDNKIKNYIDKINIYGKSNFISQIKILQVNPNSETDIRFSIGDTF